MSINIININRDHKASGKSVAEYVDWLVEEIAAERISPSPIQGSPLRQLVHYIKTQKRPNGATRKYWATRHFNKTELELVYEIYRRTGKYYGFYHVRRNK